VCFRQRVYSSLFQILEPEVLVGRVEVGALIAAVAVHAVRIDHEFEIGPLTLQGVYELQGILEVHVVVSGSVGDL